MNPTKKKILIASLKLYNKLGINNVSQRMIADRLDISPGNLTYHFKKKDEICEALYFEFTGIIKTEVDLFLQKPLTVVHSFELIKTWFDYLYEYRFIFIDLPELIRNNKKIAKSYKKFVKLREALFLSMLKELLNSKSIRKEEFNQEYKLLYNRLHMVSDYYLTYFGVVNETSVQDEELKHIRMFFSAIHPFLTKKGRKELGAVLKF